MAWIIAYRHSLRSDEAGVKFLRSEAEAVAEGGSLEALGYVIERIRPTSKARIEAFVAGSSDLG
jgi:hypothetical protein